jgi:hypothetical protein
MTRSGDESETVLGRARVREVTGIFRARDAIDAAADQLLRAGFDRADIDVVAAADAVARRLGAPYIAPEELPDVPQMPRRPLIAAADVSVYSIAIASTLGAVAAGATVYRLSYAGARDWVIGVSAILIGVFVALAGFLLSARMFRRDPALGFDNELAARRGLILWVRLHSPEQEPRAQEILRAYGAQAVRVHEIEREKRPDDLPLAKVRPDPWLGSEPLGRP